MVDARAEVQWAHTSTVLAMIANVNRDTGKRPTPFKPADFNPLAGKTGKGIALTADNIGILKAVFVDGRGT